MKKIEKDYLDALERLVNNAPTHPKLKAKSMKGALKINVSTVALEAGRSRTSIATQDCKFPDIRARIIEHMKPVEKANNLTDVINTLRSKHRDIHIENKKLWSENANLIREVSHLRKQLDRAQKALKRATNKQSTIQNTIVPFPTTTEEE